MSDATVVTDAHKGRLTSASVWAALRDHGERNSILDREINRTIAELAERGVSESGIAIETARDLAHDHGLAWDESLERFVRQDDKAPLLTADQRLVVTEAGRHFAETGEWPALPLLVRGLARSGVIAGVRSAVHSLPSNIGFESQQTFVLTAEGLALSGQSTDVLEALVWFAGAAANVYVGHDDPPTITETQVAAAVGDELSSRLVLLLETERFLILSRGTVLGPTADENVRVWEATEGAAPFQNCTTIDQYLTLRRQIVPRRDLPPPPAPPAVAPASTGVVNLASLHPEVRDAVADLVLGGHAVNAVLPACHTVADMLRSRTGLKNDGTALAEQASTQLVLGGDPDTRTGRNIHEGTKLMLQGLMRDVRNTSAHQSDRITAEEAAEMIGLCSLLARRVESAVPATPDPSAATSSES